MVYKNLIYRSIFAIILFILYLISITFQNFLFLLASVIYLIIICECFIYFKKLYKYIFIYILISYLCFIIYFFNYFDDYLFNIFIFIIIIFDTLSYFTGNFFGKNYIFKKISPKKTFEGYLGGVLFTNFFVFSYIFYTNDFQNLKFIFFFTNSVIFTSLLGDLLQSYFKRKNNIKNSSTFLPGHGGFFDRFDSLLLSVITILFFSF